ncbi:MAG: ATP synthase F1 subunit gamma [Flavobacteriales bacterium]|nr:ATP synthase F1 subunit gamma [Flavobacteriales bacterium]
MPSLKDVRDRISSVSSTKQITSAMKMVSAAKLKRAQDAIVRMRPYSEKLNDILGNLSASIDTSESPYFQERDVQNVLILPVTSNRGLCGAFNANVIKETGKLIEKYKGKNITVLAIGKKADDHFKKTEYNIKGTFLPRNTNELFDGLNYDKIVDPAEKIMKAFEHKDFDVVHFVYNRFKNAGVQILTSEQFLPILPNQDQSSESAQGDYIFEPNKAEIVEDLIPKSLKTQFYKVLLDSHAAEHGARMTAMHKATDNATDMIKELKLSYNKARQAAITGEILEIVGGAEALNN